MKNSFALMLSFLILTLSVKPSLGFSNVSFGIYPPKISIITAPNQTISIPVKVVNGEDVETLSFLASAIKSDEEGSVELVSTEEEAVSWLKVENKDLSKASVKINAGVESSFNLKIDIPGSALVNDHYIALIVSAENDEVLPAIHSRGIPQIAVPIIISVKEKSEPESLEVEQFSIPIISLDSKIPVRLKLKNPGKYLVETIGTITAESPFSGSHREILPNAAVLSNSSRVLGGKNFIFQTESIGPTNITISIQLDQSNNLTISKNVFILPLNILIIFSIIITVIVLILLSLQLSTPSQERL